MKYRFLLVAATVIWGSSFIIVKSSTDAIAPAWILVIRFFIAGFLLFLFFIKKRSLYFKKEYILIGLLFGLALFFAYYVQTIGIMYTTPGKNAFLTAPYCVMVPFFAWLVIRKKPTWFNILAALTCLVGIGFVSLDPSEGFSINIGDLLTLVGAVFYAIHIVLVSKFSKGRDIYVLTMWQFFGVGIFALIVGLFTGNAPSLSQVPTTTIAGVLYLAVFCTAVALLFQNMGQAHVPPASASLLLSLESVFGVAFSVVLGGEVLTLPIVIGFVLIFIAIVISEVLPERLAKRPSEQGESA